MRVTDNLRREISLWRHRSSELRSPSWDNASAAERWDQVEDVAVTSAMSIVVVLSWDRVAFLVAMATSAVVVAAAFGVSAVLRRWRLGYWAYLKWGHHPTEVVSPRPQSLFQRWVSRSAWLAWIVAVWVAWDRSIDAGIAVGIGGVLLTAVVALAILLRSAPPVSEASSPRGVISQTD